MSNKKHIIVLSGIAGILAALAITTELFFNDTLFGRIVDNSIGKFFNVFRFLENQYVTVLETLTILVFVYLLIVLINALISVLMRQNARQQTVGILFRGIVKYTLSIVGVFLILSAWGVQTPTLLAGAGILGLAISFGSQSLIEDVISGLFIVFERQFQVGDVIQIDTFRGVVKEIGIRTTKFEDINGDLKILNNSDIRGAINTSNNLSPAICDISIRYEEDLERVEAILEKHLPRIKDEMPIFIEGPVYRGVQALADSSVVLRIYARVHEHKRHQATRDLNRAMKLLFDREGIQIPFPQIDVHQKD